MKVAICDDSEFYIKRIRSLIHSFCEERGIKYSCDFFLTGDSLLDGMSPDCDIVFLDVTMPGINGIETAKRLRDTHPSVFIVFITAFIEYAPKGYEVNAFQYLLKDQLDLLFESCMEALQTAMNAKNVRILFHFVEGDKSLKLSDIVYIESNRHKLKFSVNNGDKTYTLYQKLDEIERLIHSSAFLRVHKSFLINMNFVCKIERYYAILSQGMHVPIPKDRYTEVLRSYILFRGW